jgi:hypothetical protein
MSTRAKKTVTTSLPPEELVALDRVCKRDNLTRAQALREAIRRYVPLCIARFRPEDPSRGRTSRRKRGDRGRAGANRSWRVRSTRRPEA